MPNKYDKLAKEAKDLTDNQFRSRFSSLTKLSDSDIEKIISDSGISKENLADLLAEVKNATEFNEKRAKSVTGIQNGVQALLSIVKKVLL